MLISTIVSKINQKLAGELLRESDLILYMDKVIVDINSRLQAKFPNFTEAKTLPGFNGDFNFFPDKYVLGVVVPGAAYYFYIDEEEGERVASTFESEYATGLFIMVRDYLQQVPEIFKNDQGGYLDMAWPYDANHYNGSLFGPGDNVREVFVGIQGLKGDKGDRGERGLRGVRGVQGPKGDSGVMDLTQLKAILNQCLSLLSPSEVESPYNFDIVPGVHLGQTLWDTSVEYVGYMSQEYIDSFDPDSNPEGYSEFPRVAFGTCSSDIVLACYITLYNRTINFDVVYKLGSLPDITDLGFSIPVGESFLYGSISPLDYYGNGASYMVFSGAVYDSEFFVSGVLKSLSFTPLTAPPPLS